MAEKAYKVIYSSLIFERKSVVIRFPKGVSDRCTTPEREYEFVKRHFESKHPGSTVLHVEEVEDE